MNGYRILVYREIKHNGKFQFNNCTYHVVHADTEAGARAKVELKPAEKTEIPGLLVEASEEWIHSVTFLGKVQPKTIYEYIKED